MKGRGTSFSEGEITANNGHIWWHFIIFSSNTGQICAKSLGEVINHKGLKLETSSVAEGFKPIKIYRYLMNESNVSFLYLIDVVLWIVCLTYLLSIARKSTKLVHRLTHEMTYSLPFVTSFLYLFLLTVLLM